MYPVPLMNVSVAAFSTLIMKLINVLLRLQPNRPCSAIVPVTAAPTTVPKKVAVSTTMFIAILFVEVVATCFLAVESNWLQVKTSLAALIVISCNAGMLSAPAACVMSSVLVATSRLRVTALAVPGAGLIYAIWQSPFYDDNFVNRISISVTITSFS